MSPRALASLAKALQALGLVIVLIGVFWSISLGLEDEGLSSMRAEIQGLAVGGALFLAGWLLERRIGRR